MSHVTGVVLICGLLDADTGEDTDGNVITGLNIESINDWLRAKGVPSQLVRLDDKAGGSKHPQFGIFAAGINYMPDGLADFVRSLQWEEPSEVILIAKTEERPYEIRGFGDHPEPFVYQQVLTFAGDALMQGGAKDAARGGYDLSRLKSLREQVKALTGPSREVNGALHWEFQRASATRSYHRGALGRPRDLPDVSFADLPAGLGKAAVCFDAPPYTASLDASLALVERVLPGWDSGLMRQDGLWAAGVRARGHPGNGGHSGATAPLALLLALLNALIGDEE